MVVRFAVSKNILIVESENDKYFIEALIQYLNIQNVEVDTPICNINDYECLSGVDSLPNRLKDLKKEIASKDIEKIGILIDADDKGIDERIQFINAHLKQICSDVNITQINMIEYSHELDVNFVCCITHVDGNGELETLLRTVKSENSTYADCLNAWQTCLPADKKLAPKEFDKFWVQIYQRYDCCTKEDKKQAGKKCNSKMSLKEKPIWNFKHEAFTDLKAFLQLF